jgi:acetyl esterase/lipase
MRRDARVVALVAALSGCRAPATSKPAPSASATGAVPVSSSSATPSPSAGASPVAAEVFPVWPGGVPDPLPGAPSERVEDGRVYAVSVPTLSAFPARRGAKPSPAVIVCPGGGYRRLAVTHEGSDITRFFNDLGVTAFVLKYRIDPFRHPAPLRDVLQSVRLLRSRAAELGIDEARIGVFGSSAGGHLAASAGTLFDVPEGKTGAALDAVSARPDFLLLLYPVVTMKPPHVHAGSRDMLLGEKPAEALLHATSVEEHVTARTPPAFIVHTSEDQSVPLENSLLFYRALRAAKVPAELHLYERGPHGFGLRQGLGPASSWPLRCAEWLKSRGVVRAAP